MQPSFDHRIRTMNKALTEVILPAIEPDNKGAVEQLQLVVGSLNLMNEQIDYAHWFEVTDGRSMVTMAEKLAGISGQSIDPATEKAIASVRDAGSRHNVTLTAVRQANYDLREALSAMITRILENSDATTHRAVSLAVIDMSEDQTSRERAFVAKTGFDVFPDSLKSIADALAAAPAG